MNPRHALSASLLALLVILSACSKDEPGAKPAAGATRARAMPPNVLVLTLDTTRADHLGCYGDATAETPNLDKVAAASTRFENAYTEVPLTLPSHASLFTGLFPPEHGLHDNGRRSLAPSVPTLAELFARHGYRTGAFVSSNVLDSSFGLARGFETYDDFMGPPDAKGQVPLQRIAEVTANSAMTWFAADKTKPFFAWVHFYDPHSTYDPPSPFRERHANPYDGEIAYMDAQIGRILVALQTEGRLASTIIVAVADHGEGLGDHGEDTHGFLVHGSTMHIPLIVRVPGKPAVVVTTPVQMVDIAPTIADILRFPDPPRMSGRSLAAALDGKPLPELPIYGESEYCWINFGWSPLYSALTPRWKYIRSSTPELFDLAKDPKELDDRSASELEPAANLAGELDRMRAAMVTRAAPKADVDPELTRSMQGLGYTSSGSSARPDPSKNLRLPKAMLSVLNDFNAGVGFLQHGKPDKAVALLERAVQACPDGAAFHWQLGIAYHHGGRFEDARRELEQALTLDPTMESAHYYLGQVFAALGKYDEALKHFDRALEMQPLDYLSLVAKAWTLVRIDKKGEAAEVLRTLISKRPNDPTYPTSLARLLRDTGQPLAAVEVLEDGLKRLPADEALATFCAWERATSPDSNARNGKRAVELAERIVKQSGRANPHHLDILAAAYAEAGRFDDALKTMDETMRVAGDAAEPELVDEWKERRALYLQKQPYRAP